MKAARAARGWACSAERFASERARHRSPLRVQLSIQTRLDGEYFFSFLRSLLITITVTERRELSAFALLQPQLHDALSCDGTSAFREASLLRDLSPALLLACHIAGKTVSDLLTCEDDDVRRL